MIQEAPAEQPLGRAGHLPPLHQNVIAARGLRLQAQALQSLHNGTGEPLHGQPLRVSHVGDEGVVQVAQVMVHGAAAGGAAHHMDLMGLHKGPVDLSLGVLVLSDDDGVVVLPQEQILPRPPAAEYRLFKRQIVKRVLGPGLQIVNLLTHGRLLCKKCRMFFLLYTVRAVPAMCRTTENDARRLSAARVRERPPRNRTQRSGLGPGRCEGKTFYQMALVSTSCFSRAVKSAMDMAPRSSPVRRRTETVWFSISRSPTTSI